jgi:hypothetical protein
MQPQQVKIIGGHRIEQFFWNNKWVVYVDNKKAEGTFKEVCAGVTEAAIKGDYFDPDDLKEAMNNVIRDSNVLNCVFHKDDPDFTDMNEVEVEYIE